MDLLSKLMEKDSELIKSIFIDLIKDYLTPSFGSLSKRDFDILLFMKLQELNVIDKTPELYELISELKVTRSKARNLLYESKLRTLTNNDLENELKNILINPIFLTDTDKLGIEIANPYLIDHLKFKLKKLGHITDGSFSPELVKMTKEAYLSLIETYFIYNDEEKQNIIQELINNNIIEDTSFKGLLSSALSKLAYKIAGNAGEEALEEVSEYLSPFVTENKDLLIEKITNLFIE